MNSYGKKLMGIALIAALSSGITIGAFSILNKSADSKIQDQSIDRLLKQISPLPPKTRLMPSLV